MHNMYGYQYDSWREKCGVITIIRSVRMRLYYYLLFFLLNTSFLVGQNQLTTTSSIDLSTLGYSGFINTPSAYTVNWSSLSFGFSHFNKEITNTHEEGITDGRAFWSTIGFLPRAELTLRITRPYNAKHKNYGIGDRSVAVRFQVLKEKKYLPALVIGIHDPLSVKAFFNTNYVVLTKSYQYNSVLLIGNVGYGFKVEETVGHHLLGIFGALQVNWKQLKVMAEYDADYFNIGAKYQFKQWMALSAALVGTKYLSASVNLRFKLAQ